MDKFEKVYQELEQHIMMQTVVLPFKKVDHQYYSPQFTRYLVTLKCHENEIVFNYYAHTEPSTLVAFGYLVILAGSVHNLTFLEFCETYHYDQDSIKARNKFKECKKLNKKLLNLVGYDLHMELMSC